MEKITTEERASSLSLNGHGKGAYRIGYGSCLEHLLNAFSVTWKNARISTKYSNIKRHIMISLPQWWTKSMATNVPEQILENRYQQMQLDFTLTSLSILCFFQAFFVYFTIRKYSAFANRKCPAAGAAVQSCPLRPLPAPGTLSASWRRVDLNELSLFEGPSVIRVSLKKKSLVSKNNSWLRYESWLPTLFTN